MARKWLWWGVKIVGILVVVVVLGAIFFLWYVQFQSNLATPVRVKRSAVIYSLLRYGGLTQGVLVRTDPRLVQYRWPTRIRIVVDNGTYNQDRIMGSNNIVAYSVDDGWGAGGVLTLQVGVAREFLQEYPAVPMLNNGLSLTLFNLTHSYTDLEWLTATWAEEKKWLSQQKQWIYPFVEEER